MSDGAAVPQQHVTTLDVIENYFGATPNVSAIAEMSSEQIEDFGDRVSKSAAVKYEAALPDNLVYPGGFLAGHWQGRAAAEHLNLALLYYPRLLVHDPLADFFFADFDRITPTRALASVDSPASVQAGPTVWGPTDTFAGLHGRLDEVRSTLAKLIMALTELAPLLRAGILVMRPQWPTVLHRQDKMFVSVGNDVRSAAMQSIVDEGRLRGELLPTWDSLWGAHVHVGGGVAVRDEPWVNQHEFYHLAKTLAISDQAGALYVPSTEREQALLRVKAKQANRHLPASVQPIELLREVTRVLVPSLELNTKTAIAVRDSEEDFEAWRLTVRSLARSARGDTADELRERVEEALVPIRDRTAKTSSQSEKLRSTLREQSATTLITTAATAVGATVVTGSPLTSIATGLGSGVLQWLWKAYRPPSLGGTDAIVAALMRSPTR